MDAYEGFEWKASCMGFKEISSHWVLPKSNYGRAKQGNIG